jgi:uncharacterized protein (TIGR04255 family)
MWRKTAGPSELARIGVRYVNRLDIPLEGTGRIQVEKYLRVSPQLPDELGDPMSTYAMQVVLPLGSDDCGLILNSSTVPSPLVGFASFVLDLDVYCETSLPRRDDELWTLLDKMRDHKNRLFERCITDAARVVFNQ